MCQPAAAGVLAGRRDQNGKAAREMLTVKICGTGDFDMVAYDKFNDGQMGDYVPTDADLVAGLATLPAVAQG